MIERPSKLVSLTNNEVQIAKENNLTNEPIKVKSNSISSIIWKNVFTFFNLLNVIFAILLLSVGSYRNMLFMIVVVSNTLIGTIQEIRAKKTRDKLNLLFKKKVSCIRNDLEEQLNFDDLVIYDLIVLRRGDQIPADTEIEDGSGAVNESLLTGESDAVFKSEGDILLSGSFVTEGVFYARLTKVGKDSYINKIQTEAKEVNRPKSELLLSMNKIIRVASYFIIPIGLILFYKESLSVNSDISKSIPNIVAAMIGMLPSGLILLTSIALAIGVINLGKRNTLVNELHGIETLARVDVLCLDKTGTITTGKMKLSNIISLNDDFNYAEDKIKYFVCNIAEQNETISAIRRGLGDLKGLNIDNPNTVQFNSERKWSSICCEDGKSLVFGAPSFVSDDELIAQKAIELSKKGERVLILSECNEQLSNDTIIKSIATKPICLITIIDVIREDIYPTLDYFDKQGVNLKVISGDDKYTVARIAKDAGIKGTDLVLDNNDLENKEILDNLYKYNVFGRITPKYKQKILENLKSCNHYVAMTGDGVNDIQALKTANCSIAMGSGSSATRSVAQIVLLDDNFGSMPYIVDEGRRVINNITISASLFLIKTIFSALLSLATILFSFNFPFQPIQLTLISTLTIGVPSFFLTFQPNKNRVKGNFFSNVLSNSLAGGISVFVLAIACVLMQNTLKLNSNELSSLITIVSVISGIWALFRICMPLNLYKGILLVLIIISFLIIVFVFPSFFYLVSLSKNALYAVALSIIISPLIQITVYKIVTKLMSRNKDC